MPIDREDGRHDCSPNGETPNAEGVWVCPGCEQAWTFLPGESLWLHTEDLAAHYQDAFDAVQPLPSVDEPVLKDGE